MNAHYKKLRIKKSFTILTFILAALLMSSCSQKILFPTSGVLPAAEAVLEINKNDNNNYEVVLEIEKIAEPDRLTPPRRTYTAWMVTARHGTINIGNLNISRKNSAFLKTATPYEPIRVFITAEDNFNALVPSTQVVLNSEEFKVK